MCQTFFIPALISLAIYVLLTFVILPIYRRHRQRYAQYLPLDRISESTSTIWSKTYAFIHSRLHKLPWLRERLARWNRHDNAALDDDDGLFDEEEGEGLVGFDVDATHREALVRDNARPDLERRLSRDLEEGFRDDSDEEAETPQAPQNPR